jgi:hypothetical protein
MVPTSSFKLRRTSRIPGCLLTQGFYTIRQNWQESTKTFHITAQIGSPSFQPSRSLNSNQIFPLCLGYSNSKTVEVLQLQEQSFNNHLFGRQCQRIFHTKRYEINSFILFILKTLMRLNSQEIFHFQISTSNNNLSSISFRKQFQIINPKVTSDEIIILFRNPL